MFPTLHNLHAILQDIRRGFAQTTNRSFQSPANHSHKKRSLSCHSSTHLLSIHSNPTAAFMSSPRSRSGSIQSPVSQQGDNHAFDQTRAGLDPTNETGEQRVQVNGAPSEASQASNATTTTSEQNQPRPIERSQSQPLNETAASTRSPNFSVQRPRSRSNDSFASLFDLYTQPRSHTDNQTPHTNGGSFSSPILTSQMPPDDHSHDDPSTHVSDQPSSSNVPEDEASSQIAPAREARSANPSPSPTRNADLQSPPYKTDEQVSSTTPQETVAQAQTTLFNPPARRPQTKTTLNPLPLPTPPLLPILHPHQTLKPILPAQSTPPLHRHHQAQRQTRVPSHPSTHYQVLKSANGKTALDLQPLPRAKNQPMITPPRPHHKMFKQDACTELQIFAEVCEHPMTPMRHNLRRPHNLERTINSKTHPGQATLASTTPLLLSPLYILQRNNGGEPCKISEVPRPSILPTQYSDLQGTKSSITFTDQTSLPSPLNNQPQPHDHPLLPFPILEYGKA